MRVRVWGVGLRGMDLRAVGLVSIVLWTLHCHSMG